jgi:hypothetical protein
MKSKILKYQREIVGVSSIVGTILFLIMLVQGIKMTMNLSISGAKMDQFVVMLA